MPARAISCARRARSIAGGARPRTSSRKQKAASAAAKADEAYLRHAADELIALEPEAGEEERLAAERQLMMNSEKLAADTAEALSAVGGDSGAEDALMTAIRRLERVAERAEGLLDPSLEALERALVETREASARLEEAQNKLDFEPGRLEKVESRLFALRAAARKHQCQVDDLEALAKTFAARLEAIETGEGRIAALKKDAAEARAAFLVLKDKLSAVRDKAAKKLDKAVSAELAPLMLGKARFVTRVEALGESGWGPEGGDRVVFEIATIPDAPPGPLSKIASGGELSRFLLALRVVLAATGSAPDPRFSTKWTGASAARWPMPSASVSHAWRKRRRFWSSPTPRRSPRAGASLADLEIRRAAPRPASSPRSKPSTPKPAAKKSPACSPARRSPTKPAPPRRA